MDTNELSAKYIYEDRERLQMALHVYDAMPTVRKYLIEGIFNEVGEHVAEKVDGVEWNCDEEAVYFWTKETGDFNVYARVERGKRGVLSLNAGVTAEENTVTAAEKDEIRERFETKSDLETWSYGESFSSNTTVAYAVVHHEYGDARWDQDPFLRRAILNRDEVVSGVAELLVRIYEGVFVR